MMNVLYFGCMVAVMFLCFQQGFQAMNKEMLTYWEDHQ